MDIDSFANILFYVCASFLVLVLSFCFAFEIIVSVKILYEGRQKRSIKKRKYATSSPLSDNNLTVKHKVDAKPNQASHNKDNLTIKHKVRIY